MKKISQKIVVLKMTVMALFAFSLLLPLSASSMVRGGSVEISPFLGYNFFEESQNLEGSLIYGGRLGFNFTKSFGLEGTLGFVNSSVSDPTITGSKQGQFRSPIDKVDLAFYHLDAIFHFMPDDDFTLFAVAGFGGLYYNPSISSADMSTFELGLGAKYWLGDNLGLRLDVRDNVVTEFLHEDALFKNSYQNVNVSLGLIVRFGGETAAQKAARAVIFVAEVPEPKVEETVAVIAAEPPVEEAIVVLAFEDVHFNYDKSTLSAKAKAIMKRSIQILRDNPKARIRIAGYTSASGTGDYNQALSERRAKAVKEYLVQEGIVSRNRLSTIGFGETHPATFEVAPKQHYSKAAKSNMRVLFEVILE